MGAARSLLLLLLVAPQFIVPRAVAAPPVQSSTPCADALAAGTIKYVRQGAAGTASGDDWTNAYTTLPATLTRTWTYCVADGTAYGTYDFDDVASGAQVIHVAKATTTDHGTSTGWVSTYGDGVATWSGWTITTDYYDLNGAIGGGPATWTTSLATTGFGFEVTFTPPTVCGDNGALLTLNAGADHLTVAHTHLYGQNNNYPISGIKGTLGTNTDITVRYSAIETLFGPAFHVGAWTTVFIEDNYIAFVRSTTTIDPRGFCADWHAEMISSIGTNTGFTWRYNLISNIDGTGVFAGVNMGASVTWLIYRNIFAQNFTTPIIYYCEAGSNQQSMTGLRFYQNTLVGQAGTAQGGIVIQTGCGSTDNEVRNNLWYLNEGNAFGIDATQSHTYASDNFRTEGCAPTCDKDAELLTGGTSGQDATGSPFVSYNANPLVANLHLAIDTNAGTTLGSPYNVDPDGVTATKPSRGAYEKP